MLIQRQGAYYGDVPLKLSLHSKEPGGVFAMIGDGEFRILLNEGEIEQLAKILESLSLTCSEVPKL